MEPIDITNLIKNYTESKSEVFGCYRYEDIPWSLGRYMRKKDCPICLELKACYGVF